MYFNDNFIYFRLPTVTYKYRHLSSCDKFLTCYNGSNDAVFYVLNKELSSNTSNISTRTFKDKLLSNAYGYKASRGDWSECKLYDTKALYRAIVLTKCACYKAKYG